MIDVAGPDAGERRALELAAGLEAVGRVARTAARRIARADGATFVLRDGERCFYADEDAIAPLWKGQRFPLDQCISGWAMLHDEPAVVPDIESDPRVPVREYRPTFVRSMVMVPVGHPAGAAIGAYWSATGAPTDWTVSGLREPADLTAAALHRLGLDETPGAPNFRDDAHRDQHAGSGRGD